MPTTFIKISKAWATRITNRYFCSHVVKRRVLGVADSKTCPHDVQIKLNIKRYAYLNICSVEHRGFKPRGIYTLVKVW